MWANFDSLTHFKKPNHQGTIRDMEKFNKLMSTINDIKLKLTDMEYKAICDQMAVIHKTMDKKEGFCEIKFARLMPSYNTEIQTLIIQRKNLKCEMEVVTRIQNKIEQDGSYDLCAEDLKMLTDDEVWGEYMDLYMDSKFWKATSVALISIKML